MTYRFTVLLLCAAPFLDAQNLRSLKTVTVPQPGNLSQYVQDTQTLAVLGKALFWDMQAGSDGRTACASCHFHAGADHRLQNQLSGPAGSFTPDSTFSTAQFPFHQLSDPTNNGSRVVNDSPAIAGSMGMLRRIFKDILPGLPWEDATETADPLFNANGLNTRQATGRNAPSVINAAFNYRNFWDGRASNIFTGATPFGTSDKGANVVAVVNGHAQPQQVAITNSSLASQAVGPALSGVEMAYAGKTWPKMGKKMLALTPLALQNVAPDDSLLAQYVNPQGRGLAPGITYLTLVQAAFQPTYWNTIQLVDVNGIETGNTGTPQSLDEYTAAEYNFGLFWGLAIQAYESTLIADDSPYDRFQQGVTSALSSLEQQGLRAFNNGAGNGDCMSCHTGPELTLATYTGILNAGTVTGVGGRGGNNGIGVDTGFFRTGVRPISEDAGIGGLDGFGNPLSLAVIRNAAATSGVQGLFKTPGLRNVEFTGPYFHNGGQATLEQVVAFYSRGGDFPQGGVGNGIERRNLSAGNQQALVALMKAMSDDRVRYERAPFDHPELCVPNGSTGLVDGSFPLSSSDKWAGIPAVGRGGNSVPLQTFEELLAGTGSDGSRAHHMQDACTIP